MAEQPIVIQAFVKLGAFLREFCELQNTNENPKFDDLNEIISKAGNHNGWFTKTHIIYALKQWSEVLTEKKILDWTEKYGQRKTKPKSIAIIMAGNIPLVGFHDFLSVLISGHKAVCKLSSNDTQLLPFIAELLISYEFELQQNISFIQGKLEDYDAVIATGSNNTSRYFEHYFGKKPNIIRKNRTSVAVLSGNESASELEKLGSDIFSYYGLGCRNVSKIFVPEGYDFDVLFQALFPYKDSIDHHKYANNYDYNKAVYLMSEFKILDNGFLLLKQDASLHSPISVLFYEHYSDLKELNTLLDVQTNTIQCVVSNMGVENEVAFGETQSPELYDYADGIDTVDFLLKL